MAFFHFLVLERSHVTLELRIWVQKGGSYRSIRNYNKRYVLYFSQVPREP